MWLLKITNPFLIKQQLSISSLSPTQHLSGSFQVHTIPPVVWLDQFSVISFMVSYTVYVIHLNLQPICFAEIFCLSPFHSFLLGQNITRPGSSLWGDKGGGYEQCLLVTKNRKLLQAGNQWCPPKSLKLFSRKNVFLCSTSCTQRRADKAPISKRRHHTVTK